LPGASEGRGKEWAHLNPRICLFPDRSQIVERTGALPLWSAALAVVYRRRFRYRRRGKAGSKPVAILATVDRV
jgi:hypothetical protein